MSFGPCTHQEALDEIDRLDAEIAKLQKLLGKLRWESIDKDNMEWRCETTCYVMDEIRAALNEQKP